MELQKQPIHSHRTSELISKASTKPLLDGHSLEIRKICQTIYDIAGSSQSILVQGESGTGKELIARSIHIYSTRSNAYFVPIDCSAIPSNFLEAELFGYEKGSFTGAITDRKGRLELANKGTLFVKNIEAMSFSSQSKFLRFLQESKIERVGDTTPINVDVRIIASTRNNLEDLVNKGEFSEELYNYINSFPISIPPLRRRTRDLPALIYSISEKIKQDANVEITIKPEAVELFTQYSWPGNTRELSELLERLSLLFPNSEIGVDELPEKYRNSA